MPIRTKRDTKRHPKQKHNRPDDGKNDAEGQHRRDQGSHATLGGDENTVPAATLEKTGYFMKPHLISFSSKEMFFFFRKKIFYFFQILISLKEIN